MKSKFILALLLFAATTSFAQVTTGNGTIGSNSNPFNQKLGISTSSPQYPLHIVCGDYDGTDYNLYPNNGILVEKTSGTSGASLYLRHSTTTNGRTWAITSAGSGNGAGEGSFIISDMTSVADRFIIKGGTGYVGIGTGSPTAQFHTTGTVRLQGLTSSASLTSLVVRDANANLYYRDASSLLSGTGWQLTGNSIAGSEFIGTTNNSDFRFRTNNTQRMVLSSGGNLGINVAAPSAKLHVDGAVRFENLPSGSGNALVIDGSGNLKVAESILFRNAQYEEEIEELKRQVAELKEMITREGGRSGTSGAYLEQNSPNPFSSNTAIRFFIPENTRSASLNIIDQAGNIVKTFQVQGHGKQTIYLSSTEFSSGMYYYSLIADNKVIDSKKMVLTR